MKDMFGRFPLEFGGGVNPPHAPAYPMFWESEIQVRVDIVARVNPAVIKDILKTTPFEALSDRCIFRYLDQRGHTLARHEGGFNETMVCLPVRYKGINALTYIFHYTSSETANIAGRELLGYNKKDGITELSMDEPRKWGRTHRRDEILTEFTFDLDPSAPRVPVVEDVPLSGSLHVRRLPYPDRPETAYADVIYRRYRFEPAQSINGVATLKLFPSEWDPLVHLDPQVLGAYFEIGSFGGAADTEDRRIVDVLQTPKLDGEAQGKASAHLRELSPT